MAKPRGVSVKEAVLPWNRFRRTDGRGVDAVLGPEMRSTGEVMGIADTFGESYAKSQISAFGPLPKSGKVFISLADKDKHDGMESARALISLGFELIATEGTAQYFRNTALLLHECEKNSQGPGPFGERTAVDLIVSGSVGLVINTPVGERNAARWMVDPYSSGGAFHPLYYNHGWFQRCSGWYPCAARGRTRRTFLARMVGIVSHGVKLTAMQSR